MVVLRVALTSCVAQRLLNASRLSPIGRLAFSVSAPRADDRPHCEAYCRGVYGCDAVVRAGGFLPALELAHDREEMPSDYETWHRNAVAVMNIWLARGRALEIVTIKPAEFLAWLRETGLPNTAEARR